MAKQRDIKKVVEELNSLDERTIIGLVVSSKDNAQLGMEVKLIKAKIEARNTLLNEFSDEE